MAVYLAEAPRAVMHCLPYAYAYILISDASPET